MLEPFFRDNVSLKRVYAYLAEKGHLTQQEKVAVGHLLTRVRKLLQTPTEISAVPESFSTGGAPLNAKGTHFLRTYTWSLRLDH